MESTETADELTPAEREEIRTAIHTDGLAALRGASVRKFPQMGDISARSALTIHRGTTNHSSKARPVLVLGVDGPEADNAAHHDLAVTRAYWDRLPERVRRHHDCPIVDRLEPITQKHTIEGLVMGAADRRSAGHDGPGGALSPRSPHRQRHRPSRTPLACGRCPLPPEEGTGADSPTGLVG